VAFRCSAARELAGSLLGLALAGRCGNYHGRC
jgi:hypothetical protein